MALLLIRASVLAPCVIKHKWKKDCARGSVVSAWLVEAWITKTASCCPNWLISLLLGRSVFRVFMPPLLPTRAAEEISGACSQSVAWRFLDQASGTAGRRNRNSSDKTARALSFNYLKETWEISCGCFKKVSNLLQDEHVTMKKKKSEMSNSDTHPAHEAGEHKRRLRCRLLVVALSLLHLCLFLGVFLLRLNLLMPARHSGQTWSDTRRENGLMLPDTSSGFVWTPLLDTHLP